MAQVPGGIDQEIAFLMGPAQEAPHRRERLVEGVGRKVSVEARESRQLALKTSQMRCLQVFRPPHPVTLAELAQASQPALADSQRPGRATLLAQDLPGMQRSVAVVERPLGPQNVPYQFHELPRYGYFGFGGDPASSQDPVVERLQVRAIHNTDDAALD